MSAVIASRRGSWRGAEKRGKVLDEQKGDCVHPSRQSDGQSGEGEKGEIKRECETYVDKQHTQATRRNVTGSYQTIRLTHSRERLRNCQGKMEHQTIHAAQQWCKNPVPSSNQKRERRMPSLCLFMSVPHLWQYNRQLFSLIQKAQQVFNPPFLRWRPKRKKRRRYDTNPYQTGGVQPRKTHGTLSELQVIRVIRVILKRTVEELKRQVGERSELNPGTGFSQELIRGSKETQSYLTEINEQSRNSKSTNVLPKSSLHASVLSLPLPALWGGRNNRRGRESASRIARRLERLVAVVLELDHGL